MKPNQGRKETKTEMENEGVDDKGQFSEDMRYEKIIKREVLDFWAHIICTYFNNCIWACRRICIAVVDYVFIIIIKYKGPIK